ncbi:putative DNA-invertase from lambdoid prophage Rac [Novosphingobium sp. PhB57]|nr:putative DNA-invertase from lambdoid prophage Rac [Novosphingobium sp. PhB57]
MAHNNMASYERLEGTFMSRLAYFRVSTGDQSIEAQRSSLPGPFDKEFADEGISGAIPAESRPGFAAMLDYVREGDTIHVASIDRLGRDALNVQAIVRKLIEKGVTVEVLGLGAIAKGVGELIVAVLAQIADMERSRIKERCDAGREAARASLTTTGKTHRGKASLGRPMANDASTVARWRTEHEASIQVTATHFNLSPATVKRYCASTNKIKSKS